jgi:hypothetical protein
VQLTLYQVRKEAFEGLLCSYAALAEEWSNQRAKQFAFWEAKVQLVASADVCDAIARLKASEPGSPARDQAHHDFIAAMRTDLEAAANPQTMLAERKEAFEGLLGAYAALAEEWSNQRAKQFAFWEAKVQLVASADVCDAIARLKASEPGSPARNQAHHDFIAAMRADLAKKYHT